MVQNYIKGMSNRGAVITWTAANAAAKALIKKYPGVTGDIDLDSHLGRKVYFAEWDSRDTGKIPQRITQEDNSLINSSLKPLLSKCL